MKNIYFIYFVLLLSSPSFAGLNQFVTERNIFSGEVASNLTPGAPLSVSSTGKVTTGISNGEVGSGTASTCTTTAGTLNGMTVTPVAGTYLVLFSSDFSSANAGITVTLEFQVAATLWPFSQRKFSPFAGGTLTSGSQRIPASLNSIIVVNGSQAITVNCQMSANSASTASMALDYVRLQ